MPSSRSRFPIVFHATIAALLCLSSSAFSADRSNASPPKQVEPPAIQILDRHGRVLPNEAPSATGQTFDVAVGSGGNNFNPSTVNVIAGDTVKWTWFGNNHNVRSGNPCTGNGAFCSTIDTNCTANALSNINTVYSHTFSQAGTFSYFCSQHCGSGMTGTVNVTAPFITITSVVRDGAGFVINGLTLPNLPVTIKASPDLITTFGTIGTATASLSGAFTFTDASATSLSLRFYRATYP